MDNQQFVKENKKINNFPNNTAAHNLSDYYYQEIYDFLTKKPGERYSKRLMEEIDEKRRKLEKYSLRQKEGIIKKSKTITI